MYELIRFITNVFSAISLLENQSIQTMNRFNGTILNMRNIRKKSVFSDEFVLSVEDKFEKLVKKVERTLSKNKKNNGENISEVEDTEIYIHEDFSVTLIQHWDDPNEEYAEAYKSEYDSLYDFISDNPIWMTEMITR